MVGRAGRRQQPTPAQAFLDSINILLVGGPTIPVCVSCVSCLCMSVWICVLCSRVAFRAGYVVQCRLGSYGDGRNILLIARHARRNEERVLKLSPLIPNRDRSLEDMVYTHFLNASDRLTRGFFITVHDGFVVRHLERGEATTIGLTSTPQFPLFAMVRGLVH